MTPEQALKRKIKDYLDAEGVFWSMVAGGTYSKPGDPDMIACVDGLFLGIEAKTPEGRVSDIQYQRAHEIVEAGGMWVCARSVADVEDAVAECRVRHRWHGD